MRTGYFCGGSGIQDYTRDEKDAEIVHFFAICIVLNAWASRVVDPLPRLKKGTYIFDNLSKTNNQTKFIQINIISHLSLTLSAITA